MYRAFYQAPIFLLFTLVNASSNQVKTLLRLERHSPLAVLGLHVSLM